MTITLTAPVNDSDLGGVLRVIATGSCMPVPQTEGLPGRISPSTGGPRTELYESGSGGELQYLAYPSS